jgi:hypothetical protein
VPMSEMIPPGRPRTATILSSSRATRMPEIDVWECRFEEGYRGS